MKKPPFWRFFVDFRIFCFMYTINAVYKKG